MEQYIKAALLRVIHKAIHQFVKPERIIQNPFVAGKVFPLQEEGDYYILEKPLPNLQNKLAAGASPANASATYAPAADTAILAAPVPPPELRMGYGDTEEGFLASGREHVGQMLEILAQAGEDSRSLSKVLELGCATARMLRFYPYHEGESELWGVDIMARNIAWCQQHLSPPLRFATTTTAPHLPFEDNYFDLVYCGSVFTHVSDLADAWFLELRRVLRPGGYMYITIHDRNSIDILLKDYRQSSTLVPLLEEMDTKTSILSKEYASFSVNSDPYSQVFYDADYIIGKWSQFAGFVSKTENAYGYQTALVFQKA